MYLKRQESRHVELAVEPKYFGIASRESGRQCYHVVIPRAQPSVDTRTGQKATAATYHAFKLLLFALHVKPLSNAGLLIHLAPRLLSRRAPELLVLSLDSWRHCVEEASAIRPVPIKAPLRLLFAMVSHGKQPVKRPYKTSYCIVTPSSTAWENRFTRPSIRESSIAAVVSSNK